MDIPFISKNRKYITVILVVALVLPSLAVLPNSSAASPSGTATPIKHVVIIILENHAFDSVFGTYPFGYPPVVNNVTLSVMRPVNYIYNLSYVQLLEESHGNVTWVNVTYKGKVYHPYYANSTVLVDPQEGYINYHTDWDWGRMDGFINGSGVQSLAYISYEQVPLLWDYAEEYVLFDDFFSPTLSVTVPNRLAYITGYPTVVENDSPVFGFLPLNATIVYQLSQYNVSWGWYEYGYSRDFQFLSPTLYLGYNNTAPLPLSEFKGSSVFDSHYHDLTDFIQEALNGSLPAVSFVMFTGPYGYDEHVPGYDMHPPYNTTLAMMALAKVINSVMEGKDWNSTAIFITFDEGGGYYDPVPPPIVYGYGIANAPTMSKYMKGYFTLGQRIPLLVISPYAKEGFVDNYTASGYSILAFIDYNWHLPYLNPIVKEFGPQAILYAFNFSQSPRPPIILTPQNWTYPLPLQYPVHYGYVATIHNNYTAYQVLYRELEMGNYSLPTAFVDANVPGNVVATGAGAATSGGSSPDTAAYAAVGVVVVAVVIALGVLYSRRRK